MFLVLIFSVKMNSKLKSTLKSPQAALVFWVVGFCLISLVLKPIYIETVAKSSKAVCRPLGYKVEVLDYESQCLAKKVIDRLDKNGKI